MNKVVVAVVLILGLSACGGKDEVKEQGGQAQGQILPGSVSDEMIALDQVKSQAPLAPKSESSGAEKKGAAKTATPKAPSAASVAEAPAVQDGGE